MEQGDEEEKRSEIWNNKIRLSEGVMSSNLGGVMSSNLGGGRKKKDFFLDFFCFFDIF
jgi:hypothetical protein